MELSEECKYHVRVLVQYSRVHYKTDLLLKQTARVVDIDIDNRLNLVKSNLHNEHEMFSELLIGMSSFCSPACVIDKEQT